MVRKGDSFLTGFSDQAEIERSLATAIRQNREIRTKAKLDPHIAPTKYVAHQSLPH